jgi:hypothetical protein
MTSVYDEAPGRAGFYEGKFREFHADNPEVYRELVTLARRAKASGRAQYGIKALMEILRWHRNIETKSLDEWKLNNNHAPYYARLIMEKEPDLADFFELREAGHERVKP